MKSFGLVIAMVLGTSAPFAQETLQPETPGDAKYRQKIAVVFHEAFGPEVVLRMVERDALYPESAIAIRQSGKDTFLLGLKSSRAIFSVSSPNEIRETLAACHNKRLKRCEVTEEDLNTAYARLRSIHVQRCTRQISPQLASKIAAVWRESLRRARAGDDRLGVDGSILDFAIRVRSSKLEGQVWSPDEGTMPGDLVSLASGMSHLCWRDAGADAAAVARKAGSLALRLEAEHP